MRAEYILRNIQNNNCYFCDLLLVDNLVVHHKNHDHKDNRISNRSLAHRHCHSRYHGMMKMIPNSSSKSVLEYMKSGNILEEKDPYPILYPYLIFK